MKGADRLKKNYKEGRKHTKKLELAVYGKGGIGKSTISANLSAALAFAGKKVMQIGCDPKHDSTRLLMHGRNLPTVLDYLKDTEKENARLEDILGEGCFGIGCIEAGGPRPGVGCAGRGIISAFEFLDQHKAKSIYDIVLYDVLGDVVCGGFAVPVRREYADAIFLVTSGEYMALYAANNILRGIQNYDGDRYKRVAGIIYNERKITDEDGRVERFAKAVGLPICAKVPRSDAFARAEEEKLPLMELNHCEEEQKIFRELADQIISEPELYQACPLTDEELEQVVLGTVREPVSESKFQWSHAASETSTKEAVQNRSIAITVKAENEEKQKSQAIVVKEERKATHKNGVGTGKKNMENLIPKSGSSPNSNRPPLYGCAFNGAATTAVHLTDALVIAHSPKSCAFYTWQNISSPGRKNLFNRGILMPSAISPNFECTDMGQHEAVFGGMDKLRECVRTAMKRKPGAVIVISSCVSGMIGDDIRTIEELSTPEIPVIAIHADGDIAGDYMEGIRMCMHTIAEKLIDKSIKPEGRRVNIINETGIATTSDINYRIISGLLNDMGIEVNCRYLGDADCSQMRNLLAAPLNILASDTADGRDLKAWMIQQYGCQFMDEAFPIGFQSSRRWFFKLGEFFSCQDKVEKIIKQQEIIYQEEIEKLKPTLEGKRIMMTTINSNVDWILETADALGMKFVRIGVVNYLHQEVKITDYPERYPIDEDFDWKRMYEDVEELKPDIILSNYTSQVESGAYVIDATPMCPVVGFLSGIHMARRWAELFQIQREGEWRNDKALFEKYYA